MYSHYAFVSETGNYVFNFDENIATNYFVVSSLLITKKNIKSVQKKADNIQLDLVPSKMALQDKEKLINKLLPLEFQIHTVVINKNKLHFDGGHENLEASFKYIIEVIYQDLFNSQFDVLLHAGNLKTPFIKSLTNYINEHRQPDLFNRSEFLYESKTKDSIMQLTNFISNIIFDAYEYDQSTLNKLSSKIIRLEKHPTFEFNLPIDNQLDEKIATQSILAARNYIKEYQQSEELVILDRINFLKFLLTQLSIRPNKFIYGQEIIDNMKTFSAETISRDYLMSDIIGPLRDRGVLIASTSKGYKIPTSSKDLTDYVEFSSSMALPILRRIKKGREKVLEITNHKVDIIEGEEFGELRELLMVKK